MSRSLERARAFRRALVVCALACCLGATSVGLAQKPEDRLSPEHRAWLEDEVAYIITEREKDIFLSLETVEERDAFIEVFWNKRDPVVATLENEFKIEHYRRLEEADRLFSEIRSIPGRKTDRGRMFIILGEPRSREEFSNYRELITAELWFYQAQPNAGLPNFFNLLFFKPQDVGVYRLYSPVIDGPGALLRGQAGAQRQLAFDNLYRVSPDLARASLTFDLTGPVNRADASAAMLGTELIMARIEESPKRSVNTDYLDGWLQYGNRVSAEYSFNFVPSRSTFVVLLSDDGTPFLNYAVELDFVNFPVETDEDQTRFYTTIDVNLEVRDPAGNLVLEDEKQSYIELSRSQIQAMDGSSFSYQDSFPVVPGEYAVSVILRNRLLHQYTVAEANVQATTGSPSMSDVVLGFSVEESTSEEEHTSDIVTFEVAGDRVHPAANGLFAIGDTVYVYVQVKDALPEHTLRIALLDGETVLQEQTVGAGELGIKPTIRLIPLVDMTGGRLEVRCELLDGSGTALARKSAPVTVSPRTSVPRPAFTARRSFDSKEPGLLALVVGNELWSLGQFDEARTAYEEAVATNNANLPMAKWKLAGAYLRDRRAAEALELLVPLEPEFSQQYEVVLGLGLSYYLEEDLERASEYLARAMTIRAPRTSLLNALADVYLKLGQPDKARPLLERSLKLDGSQEAIQETLSTLPSG